MISAIGFNFSANNINFRAKQPLCYSPAMANGLKTDTVSFTSKNLLARTPKQITKIVKSTISKGENLMDIGSEGAVYSIPNTEYCVKILHNTKPELKEWDFSVLPDKKINHVVATSDSGVTIMKRIEGVPLRYGKELQEIYDLPDEVYKKLLTQINEAHKKYMAFDSVPKNVIYNKEKKSLTIIDFIKDDSDKYGFSPFCDVFECLSAKWKTPESEEINKRFGERLFSIAVEESNNENRTIPLIKKDLDSLYVELSWNNYLTDETEKYKAILDEKLHTPKRFSLFSRFYKKPD